MQMSANCCHIRTYEKKVPKFVGKRLLFNKKLSYSAKTFAKTVDLNIVDSDMVDSNKCRLP